MAAMMPESDPRVSAALVVWTGQGRTNRPVLDDQLVIDTFGQDAAQDLLPLIYQRNDDFHSSDAQWTVGDLNEMVKAAEAHFRSRHPDISAEAIEALAWVLSYEYR
jgi:aminoglycoside N3'-acetyltransferase